jgi:Uma2 family endonuclease
MPVALNPQPIRNLQDLQLRLGGVPLHRIRFHPWPGSATVQDMIDLDDREGYACELVEGVLVEKAMGLEESLLATWLVTYMNNFVLPRNLGIVTGEKGTFQIMPNLVRIPDVAFTSWDRMPGRTRPRAAAPLLAPDIAIEVLSQSNSPTEMAIKRGEYFSAGVCVVWEIDPRARTVTVFHSPTQGTTLAGAQVLHATPIIPGFSLPLTDLFDELDRHGLLRRRERAPVDHRVQRQQGPVGDRRREVERRLVEPVRLDVVTPGHGRRITGAPDSRKIV